jgi:hypothetical protein
LVGYDNASRVEPTVGRLSQYPNEEQPTNGPHNAEAIRSRRR